MNKLKALYAKFRSLPGYAQGGILFLAGAFLGAIIF